jgi:NAD-dependent aldehyde dehydrogenases
MVAAAGILDAEVESIATTMTIEMGKTLASAKAEVAKCAKACRYYAEHSQQFLAAEPADAAAVGANQAYAIYRPLGPVLAIMPWNFPLWQAMRFAAPALMAGNAGLLKHASNVPQTALFMEELFRRAGFPDGSFQTLLIGADAVEGVLSDRRVKGATLTGSEAAGRSPRSPAASSRRWCWSSVAVIRSWSCRRPTSTPRRGWPPLPAARTTASRASPRNASSCTPTCTTSSPTRSWHT